MTLKVLWLWGHFFCAGGSIWGIWGIWSIWSIWGICGLRASFWEIIFLRIILVNYSFCRSSLFAKSFLCGHLRFLVYSFRLMVYSLQLVPLCRTCRVLCHVPHACHVLPTWRVLFTYRVLPVCRMPCFSPHIYRFVLEMLDNQ